MNGAAPDGGPQGAGGKSRSSGRTGSIVERAGWFADLFDGAGFAVVMVAIGTTFVGESMHTRLDYPAVWGFREFLVTVGFGTLAVVLGCLDRLLHKRRTPRTGTDQGQQPDPPLAP